MHSFYNSSEAGILLALSVSLPHEDCNIHVMDWFLYAGIIYTLTGVINHNQDGGNGHLGWSLQEAVIIAALCGGGQKSLKF